MSDTSARPVLVEACVTSPAEALAAQQAGAGRLELCAGMAEGGTTPSAGMIAGVLERVSIPVFIMVRTRGGDFVYGDDEFDVMCRDIEIARSHGASGVAVGALTETSAIDRPRLERLVQHARPLPVTFHRAFDLAVDLDAALDTLLALGVDRVLTSGGAETAIAGADRIAAMTAHAGDALVVMAGGGVRDVNVRELVLRTGVREVHARPVRRLPGPRPVRRLHLGAADPAPPRDTLDAGGVRAIVDMIASTAPR